MKTLADVSIVSIQTDQSPQCRKALWYYIINKFQSYQSKQINPDHRNIVKKLKQIYGVSIVSIQTDQSRRFNALVDEVGKDNVSIVSIQTDQSRQNIKILVA